MDQRKQLNIPTTVNGAIGCEIQNLHYLFHKLQDDTNTFKAPGNIYDTIAKTHAEWFKTMQEYIDSFATLSARNTAIAAAKNSLIAAQNPGNGAFFNADGASRLVSALQQFIDNPTVAHAQAVLSINASMSDRTGNTTGFLGLNGVGGFNELTAFVNAK
ncbi:MAG: hypothetical protein NTX86_00965 [Candidatus Dependentiae bacterium]|nr:hypothetical protein [Candidatus Dependentiae bacterium]